MTKKHLAVVQPGWRLRDASGYQLLILDQLCPQAGLEVVKSPLGSMRGKGGDTVLWDRNLIIQVVGRNGGMENADVRANATNPQISYLSFTKEVV